MFALDTHVRSSVGHFEYGAEVLESIKMRNLFKIEFCHSCYFMVLRNLLEFLI